MQEVVRIGVFRKSAGHSANHGHVIDVFRCLRKQITDRDSALAVLLKLPRTGQSISDVIELSGFNLLGTVCRALRSGEVSGRRNQPARHLRPCTGR